MVIMAFNIWANWENSKLIINLRTVIYIIICTLLTLVNYFSNNSLYKFINLTLIFICIHKFYFNKKISQSIFSPILLQFIFALAESVFAFIMFIFLKDSIDILVKNYGGTIICNGFISLLAFLISKLSIVKKFYDTLEKLSTKINNISIIISMIFVLYIYSIFSFNLYYGGNPKVLLILSSICSVLAFVLVYIVLKTRNDYYKINDRYNSSLLSLKELENALTNHRIDNHENKNHLLTIRNMTKNKKVNAFIDSILDNKLDDDKRIMQETSIIPAGGLRGLIYSKLLLMSKKSIDYELDVASSVRVVDILDYSDSTMLDICKILGIFIDNSIEEMDNVEDKYIVIEMFKEEDVLKILISNTYDNTIDKTNIDKAGVTTKGDNHGYGLSLVKKIIKNNTKLKTYTEITENEFMQVLEIYK